jgi:long-chain acyl-CoA synthetase
MWQTAEATLRRWIDSPSREANAWGGRACDLDSLRRVIAGASQGRKALGLVLGSNHIMAIGAYIASLCEGHAVFLLDGSLHDTLVQRVVDEYAPSWIVQAERSSVWRGYRVEEVIRGWQFLSASEDPAYHIHPELAVLLSTSGSTGSPKTVRLSHSNLRANAASICEYLGIGDTDCAITTLPFGYSYGLSVINSHLLAGARVVLTDASLAHRDFWRQFGQHQVTSMAGVPFTYEMLKRLEPDGLPLGSLVTLTQAGGRLPDPLARHFCDLSLRRGWRFFVMYGQTEATARISYVPPERLADKIGSIGVPIPGGKLVLADSGELVYSGPNVMMGYASSSQDLHRGDELQGTLATGDLASRDAEGYFYLQGRLARIVKIHGSRISLDAVEQCLEDALQVRVAVASVGDTMAVYVTEPNASQSVRQVLRELLGIHHSAYQIRVTASIPMTASGKKDYGSLG